MNHKRIHDKFEFIKIGTFCFIKDKNMKSQTVNLEAILAVHRSDKGTPQ